MDIKIELDRLTVLCHGCLAGDRQVQSICGENKEMFLFLRNDKNCSEQREDPLLCWECVSFLQKLRIFRDKIKTAHSLVLEYLQCYCNNETIKNPKSLSTLQIIHINTYNYEYYEEDTKEKISVMSEEYEKEEKIEITEEFTEKEIKQESNDSIKEEDINNDNDSDYNNDNDSDYDNDNDSNDSDTLSTKDKRKNEKNKTKSYKRKLITNKRYRNSNKTYRTLATVSKRENVKDIKKNSMNYAEVVSLDKVEYEKLLRRDRIRYSYPRMPHKCEECRDGFFKQMDLQRHNVNNHIQKVKFPYKCAECPAMIATVKQEDQHWAQSHSTVYKCTICSEMHQSALEVNKHIKLLHKCIYTCKTCGEENGSFKDFKAHYRTAHENKQGYICDNCNIHFTKKKKIIGHMQYYHIPAYCKICDRKYLNLKTFKHHNTVTHPELISGPTPKELSYCVECDKQYPSLYKYQKHLQQSVKHTPQKKVRVPCPECGRIFAKRTYMKNHYKLEHLKVTQHYCEICDKYYCNGFGLRTHVQRVHNKIPMPKDKICDLCGRGFATNKTLTNHRRTHTGERPYKCSFCSAAFAQKTAMVTHTKSQHKHLDINS